MAASESPKYDGGKSPVHLVVPDFILGVADILAFGAKKYAAWSWTEGKDWSRDWSALARHALLWWMGEDLDPETGRSHLLHAGCDLMFLYVSWLRGIGSDDRPKLPPVRKEVLETMLAALGAGEKLAATPAETWCEKAAKRVNYAPRYLDHLPMEQWGISCGDDVGDEHGCTRPDLHDDGCEFFDGLNLVQPK